MEVMICVPKGTDISAIRKEYPDIYEDGGWDDHQRYFVGQSSEEHLEEGEQEWMDYEECVECCGFVEGAIPEAETIIEGNGHWAQSMISRTDFSGYAVDDETRIEWKKRSDLWHAAKAKGESFRRSCDRRAQI